MKAVALLLAALGPGCSWLADSEAESQSKSVLPCDRHDHAAQRDIAKNAARSKLERDACATLATQPEKDACVAKVLAERDAYVFRRCALDGGAK